MEYSFIRIDRLDPNLPALAQKYKTLRLSALQQDPTLFSSTYEVESKFSDQNWISRLSDERKETLICVATPPGKSPEDGEWVAQVTLLGPISASSYDLPKESGQPPALPDDEEEKWQMLALYTLPDHRGKGLGKKLCKAAFNYLASVDNPPKKVLVRIMVKLENLTALGLYKSIGFVDAGRTTLEEALIANGDSDQVPISDVDLGKYRTRRGRILTYSIERK